MIHRLLFRPLESRQGLKIACLEEIAFNYKWIEKKDVINAINFYGNCIYSKLLKKTIIIQNSYMKKILVTGGNGRFAQELKKINSRL